MNDKPKFPYDSDENYGASSELAESVSGMFKRNHPPSLIWVVFSAPYSH